jgi:uncharacterized protein DUF4154
LHRAAWVVVVVGLTGAVSGPTVAASLEYRVKAAFLYNFAKFIEWPPPTFAAPDTPYSLCVLGQDPFGEDLDVAAGENTVQGRRIVVKRLSDMKGITGCHILFVSNSEKRKLAAILEALGDAPVLTVGEDGEFTRMGGCLRFFLVENRVRFEINLPATERARLKVSAKLLALARVVGKAPPTTKD